MTQKNKTIQLIELGLKSYQEALTLQEELFNQTIAIKRANRNQKEQTPTQNYLLWVEHTPVITLGKSGKSEHLLLDENQLKEKGIDAHFTGCLTLTLDTYKVDDSERGDDIYIVDPLYNYPRPQKIFYNLKTSIKSILNGKAFQLKKSKMIWV